MTMYNIYSSKKKKPHFNFKYIDPSKDLLLKQMILSWLLGETVNVAWDYLGYKIFFPAAFIGLKVLIKAVI